MNRADVHPMTPARKLVVAVFAALLLLCPLVSVPSGAAASQQEKTLLLVSPAQEQQQSTLPGTKNAKHKQTHHKKKKKKKKKAKKPVVHQPTTTPPTPTPAPGEVLFDGSSPSSWYMNQSASPTRVATVSDPTGAPGSALQFTTLNGDVAPLTPTDNPRSQLDSQEVLRPGQEYWESFEVYLPASFPSSQPSNGFISLETAAYGEPFGGTPPACISIEDGDFRFQRNASAGYAVAWQEPIVKGQWVRFTWNFLFASNGWIQLYVNDQQVELADGNSQVSQLPMSMIDSTDSYGPWFADLQLYYQHNEFSSLTALFKGFRIATTQAAAEQ
jgi:hypothetical protein